MVAKNKASQYFLLLKLKAPHSCDVQYIWALNFVPSTIHKISFYVSRLRPLFDEIMFFIRY